VRGPLPIPRSPQGRIPLAQAGSSGTGMNLGARIADLVFTTQLEMSSSIEFVREVRALAASFDRPNAPKVLPGITPIIGSTEAEARELAAELGSVMSERAGLEFLKQSFGVDLSAYDMDQPFPDVTEQLPQNASVGRPRLFIRTALEEGLTLRQMVQRIGLSIGHRPLIGTPDTVAQDMQDWFEAEAADGFIVLPADLPLGLSDFVDEVVPRLQDRGLFRTAYEGSTLQEHLNS
jgi:N-acetyl-S-(2-succino)cysteine monooxygenase